MKTPRMQNIPLVHARVYEDHFWPVDHNQQKPFFLDDKSDSRKFWAHIARTLDPKGVRREAARRAAKKRAARKKTVAKCAARKKAGLIPPPLVVEPRPPTPSSEPWVYEKPWVFG